MGRRAPKCDREARAVLQLPVGRVQVENFPLYCLDNNSLKPFFQVLLLNFITKLEKNQLDMMNVTPPQLVTAAGGASCAYKDTTR